MCRLLIHAQTLEKNKKIWGYLERHDLDNQGGVITHLEPDILECEVKWALESITMNKVSELFQIQLSYFQLSYFKS